jgi:hypothetical protein
MRRILLGSIAVATLAFGSISAMAQTSPAPVPNASGSQTTDPATEGATANKPAMKRSTSAKSTMKKHHAATSTGSLRSGGTSSTFVPPVPNASGSQTTSPATHGSTANQQLKR